MVVGTNRFRKQRGIVEKLAKLTIKRNRLCHCSYSL
jgi:hypothetical protein